MISYNAHDSVVLVLGLLLLTLQILYILREVCTERCRKACKGMVVAVVNFVRLLVRKTEQKERDEIETVVDAKVEQQRLARCLRIGKVLWVAASLQVVLILYNIVASHKERLLSEVQDVVMLGACACLTCLQILPCVPKRITVDFYYSLLMLLGTVLVSPFAVTKESLLQVLGAANVFWMMLTFWQPSLAFSAFWSFCLTISICSSLAANAPIEGISNLQWVAGFEASIGAAAVTLGRVLEASMRGETRAVVENEATREVHKAACALLRSFCDVVVDLDEEGRIISEGSDLGGFLLRGRALKGLRIDNLTSNEEGRAALLKKLQTPSQEGASMADVIHVNIRDGNGKTIPMELFWFNYKGVDGQFRSLAGLREFGDVGPDGLPYRRRALCDACQQPIDTEEGMAEDSMGEQEVYAVVHAGRPGLPIAFYSTGFGINIDRFSQDACLLDYVSNGKTFVSWVQHTMNDLMSQEEPSVDSRRCFRISIRTRTSRVTATVTLSFHDESGEENDGCHGLLTRLTFTDIVQKTAGKKRVGALSRQTSTDGNESDTSSRSGGRASDRKGTKRQPSPESSGDLSLAPARLAAQPVSL